MKSKIWYWIQLAGLLLIGCATSADAQPTGSDLSALPAKLQANPNGTVSVLFRGVPGVSYQIRFTEENPDNNAVWEILASGVVAREGWTEWVDVHAPALGQWFYQVVSETVAPVTAVTTTALLTNNAISFGSGDYQVTLVRTNGQYAVISGNTVNYVTKRQWNDLEEVQHSWRLIRAVNAGDYTNALRILSWSWIHRTNSPLTAMSDRLGGTHARVPLADSFLKGWTSMNGIQRANEPWFRQGQDVGYARPLWVAASLDRAGWPLVYDRQIKHTSVPPVAVLNLGLRNLRAIRAFKWYDRYAGQLHSVALNWMALNNFDETNHAEAEAVLSAMYRLIKARKPDAFVWLTVLRSPDNSDVRWLGRMQFGYDGLLVYNLPDFSSSFSETRRQYLPYVGEGTPMVVTRFFGYADALARAEKGNPSYAEVGKVMAPFLSQQAQRLEALGYRGLLLDRLAVKAVSAAQ